ncbi:MAG TPA: RnfABCDGE type electron transport complex subunit B [Casimicrobiaceae bacterium]|nr:RnfABCDGE type electron transport complex subunit B [Casimicrobiaceae bacterium]
MSDALIQSLDDALPQTQCGRCGYDGCLPYAQAIAGGRADINRCPPGGDATIAALAAIAKRDVKALDARCGAHAPLAAAVIDEARCIGCALCIEACPVDAILGAPKQMHAVVDALCSGCELCVPRCPVDCVELVPATRAWTRQDAFAARKRHRARLARIARGERIEQRGSVPPLDDAATRRNAVVAAAVERARARRRSPQ